MPGATAKTRQRRAIGMLRARLAHLDDGRGRRGLAVLLVLARPEGPPTTVPLRVPGASAAQLAAGVLMSTLAKVAVGVVLVATVAAGLWLVRDVPPRAEALGTQGDDTADASQKPDRGGRAAKPTTVVPANPADAAFAAAGAPADADPDTDLTGVVIDPAGAPISGAEIALTTFDEVRTMLRLVSGIGAEPAPAVATAKSGADGAFRVRLPAGAAAGLRASAEDRAAVEMVRVQPGDHLRIVLGPPTTLRVTVRGDGDAPVAGAAVLATAFGRADPSFLARRGTTDAAGRVEWRDVPRHAGLRVDFDIRPGEGRAPVQARLELADATSAPVPSVNVKVEAAADPEPVTLSLAPRPDGPSKYELRAQVVDGDGNPVPAVRMLLGYSGGDVRAESDAAGGAAFRAAYEPQYVGAYLSPEQGAKYLNPWRWLRPGETDLTLVLERAEPISGRVLRPDGTPVANAWVKAMQGSRQVGAGSTDAQGAFAIGVPPGSVIDLTAEPQQDMRKPDPSAADKPAVPAGTSGVELTIRPVALDRVVEVRLDGLSPGATAYASCWFTGRRDRQIAPSSFRDGVARLEGLPTKSLEIRILVRWSADAPNDNVGLEAVRIDGATGSVRIALPEMRVVRGVVMDEAGAPCPGAYLFTTATGSGSAATAGADGRFALRLPADARTPFQVIGKQMPYDPESPLGGFDLFEREDQELRIVVRPLPKR